MKITDLVAFWRHSEFPFLLGGHVTGMSARGCAETKEYGKGNFFLPAMIVPAALGEKILAHLKTLRDAHDEKKAQQASEMKSFIYDMTKEIRGLHPCIAALFPES